MKKVGKRWMAGLLSAVLLLGGCSGEPGAGSKGEERQTNGPAELVQSTEAVNESDGAEMTPDGRELATIYQYEELSERFSMLDVMNVSANGQWVYVLGNTKREVISGTDSVLLEMEIVGMNLDTEEIFSVFSYTQERNEGGGSSFSTGYTMRVESMAVTDGGELIVGIYGSQGDPEDKQIWKIDQSGKVLWTATAKTDGYMKGIALSGDKICVPCGNHILVYDQKGYLQKLFTLDVFPEEVKAGNLIPEIQETLFVTADGSLWATFYNTAYSARYIFSVDVESGAIVDWAKTKGPSASAAYLQSADELGYDLMFLTYGGVVCQNLGSDEDTELVNFMNSDLVGEKVKQLVPMEDSSYLMLYQQEGMNQGLYRLSKTDPETLKDMQVIVLGVIGSKDIFAQDVIRFNQENKDCRIVIRDYIEYNFMEPYIQLNLDVTTGNAPDIFCIDKNDGRSLDNFARLGALEDMRPWFEGDDELEAEDYLTNVFTAMGLDGKWYQLPTAITVNAWLGLDTVFDEGQLWSLEDYERLKRTYPEKEILRGDRDSLFRDALIYRWDQFVDEDNKTCSFDSEEFISLLNWLKEFPTEQTDFDIHQVRNGNVLSMETQFRSLSGFSTGLDRLYNGHSAFIGFPGSETVGAKFGCGNILLAMSAQSQCKEGAWRFIREYFTDEYQTKYSDILPVKLSVLEQRAEQLIDPSLGNGDFYRLDGQEISVDSPARETVERWIDFIQSIEYVDMIDGEVYNIIIEETGAFFSGQKTAEQVAKTVQGRVWIYLAEQE